MLLETPIGSIEIGDDHLSYARDPGSIADEAALDGIYVLRSSVGGGVLGALGFAFLGPLLVTFAGPSSVLGVVACLYIAATFACAGLPSAPPLRDHESGREAVLRPLHELREGLRVIHGDREVSRLAGIDREVVVMGFTARPLRVPVESGEETRGRLFALVAAPPDEHAGYLESVASLAAALREEGSVEAILEAGDPERIANLPALREAPRVQRLSVVDVMDAAAQRVYPDMALPDAARVLTRGRHSALPVVNKRDEIVGMVSEKDLIKAFLPGYLRISGGAGGEDAGERSPDRTLVRDVMSKAVLCLPVEASINEAASIIVNKNVDPLPLTRDGKWVGLISRRSLIRKLLQF